MRKTMLILLLAGLTTPFVFGQKKENRPVSEFTGIDASSVFNISVTKGAVESLVIEADEALMPYVRSEVRNGVLHLYLDKEFQRGLRLRNIKWLRAYVTMKQLDKVSLSGACSFKTQDLFSPTTFAGNCSGASIMTVHLHTQQLNIEASGASKIEVKAEVSDDTRVDVSGASKVQMDLKSDQLRLNSSGVSAVRLTGSASEIKIGISGTSNVRAVDFTANSATIESSGTSFVTIGVTETLKVNSSGASFVNYKGSPTIQVRTSGASKIRSI